MSEPAADDDLRADSPLEELADEHPPSAHDQEEEAAEEVVVAEEEETEEEEFVDDYDEEEEGGEARPPPPPLPTRYDLLDDGDDRTEDQRTEEDGLSHYSETASQHPHEHLVEEESFVPTGSSSPLRQPASASRPSSLELLSRVEALDELEEEDRHPTTRSPSTTMDSYDESFDGIVLGGDSDMTDLANSLQREEEEEDEEDFDELDDEEDDANRTSTPRKRRLFANTDQSSGTTLGNALSALEYPETDAERRRRLADRLASSAFLWDRSDRDNRAVLVLVPFEAKRAVESLYPEGDAREILCEYFARLVSAASARGTYVVVVAAGKPFLAQSQEEHDAILAPGFVSSRSDLMWLVRNFSSRIAPPLRGARKSMSKLVVVHPNALTSSCLWILKGLVSRKFWRKVVYIHRTEQLGQIVSHDFAACCLPGWVAETDAKTPRGSAAEELEKRQSRRLSLRRASNGASLSGGQRLSDASQSKTPQEESGAVAWFDSYWRVCEEEQEEDEELGESDLRQPADKPSGLFRHTFEHHAQSSPFGLPSFVVRCVTYLCLHGIRAEGLFRESPNRTKLDDCKAAFARGQDVDLGGYWSPSGRPATNEDVHVCAALLKSYFRDAPKSVLGDEGYRSLMQILTQLNGDAANKPVILERIRVEVLRRVPEGHRGLLHFVLLFLHYVVSFSSVNLMSSDAMSVCWSLGLVRMDTSTQQEMSRAQENPTMDDLRMIPLAHRATKLLIENVREIFELDETVCLPDCLEQESGAPAPLEAVLRYDAVARGSSIAAPPLREREFDDLLRAMEEEKESEFRRAEAMTPPGPRSPRFSTDLPDHALHAASESPRTAERPPHVSRAEHVDALTVRELKRYIASHGVNPDLCSERSELVLLAKECQRSVEETRARLLEQNQTALAPALKKSAEPFKTGPAAARNAPASSNLGSSHSEEHPSWTASTRLAGGAAPTNVTASPSSRFQWSSARRRTKTLNRHKLDLADSAKFVLLKHAKALPPDAAPEPVLSPRERERLAKEARVAELRELRGSVMFNDSGEAAMVARKMVTDSGGKMWKLTDVDSMSTPQLRAFIRLCGLDDADCKHVSALRMRAREGFLGQGWVPPE